MHSTQPDLANPWGKITYWEKIFFRKNIWWKIKIAFPSVDQSKSFKEARNPKLPAWNGEMFEKKAFTTFETIAAEKSWKVAQKFPLRRKRQQRKHSLNLKYYYLAKCDCTCLGMIFQSLHWSLLSVPFPFLLVEFHFVDILLNNTDSSFGETGIFLSFENLPVETCLD